MCKNLELYNQVCNPPKEALKSIQAGRLKGKTDINPMWRIKELTKQFGPCGIGWNLINQKWQFIPAGDSGEMVCLCELDLVYKLDGQWSEPVHGVGGNMLVAKEKSGLYVDDDGPKKAYSDAIGTACKALGFAANVYWEKDPTKYTGKADGENDPPPPLTCAKCGNKIEGVTFKNGDIMTAQKVADKAEYTYGQALCWSCCCEAKKVAG